MQTNATQVGGEGTGGVTDFARNRAVMPFTGSYSDFEHVLMHEMAHQFQYDVWSRGRAGAGFATLVAIAPPLWFAEGMAEYLSTGPINAETAMWLRDASLEGKLPTIDQMTVDPYEYFPYRFGHALWSYVAERWGDEAVGAILKATLAGGVEPAFRRTIGLTLEQLSEQWRDAVQKRYLPEIGARARARAVADELLTEKRSDGTLHLAPALSPDGSQVAYFSEKDFYSVDMYLADGVTGKVKRRILKSGISSNYETYRFINSQANWSPDGKFLAFAAKRGPRDDILIVDVDRNKEVKRIEVEAERRHHAVVEPRRQAARLHRLRGRPERSLRREPRRQRPPPAHRGQVRRSAPGLVARRQAPSPSRPTAGPRPTSAPSRSATSASPSTIWPPARFGCSTGWTGART